jgi:hypothetical protein
MHFMPDTEDEDSAAETFWPEGYKQVIRETVPGFVRDELLKENPFVTVYEQGYKDRFSSHAELLEKLADMVAVGAENGADNAFDDIIHSFLKEFPLPQLRVHAHYTTPPALSKETAQRLRQSVIEEYGKDNIYVYAYGVGYTQTFPTIQDYFNYIAELVVTGAQNGANDTLEQVYRSFLKLAPVIPARRHPRRLKVW